MEKVLPRATATQLGISLGAEGRVRTGTGVAPQQFLRLPRLPIPPLRLVYDSRPPVFMIPMEAVEVKGAVHRIRAKNPD